MATLIVETSSGPLAIQLRGPCVIGRDAGCTVRIDHPTLSRRHARLAPAAVGGGWTLEDLDTPNGCRVEATRVRRGEAAAVADGSTLRFGRIRAWLFHDDAPVGWRPEEVAQRGENDGRIVRCPHCGRPAWAPSHAAGLELKCKACGAAIVVESEIAPPPEASASGECAACHGPITVDEESHRCPECQAVMHASCWTENRGCATYGCAQVNILDSTALSHDAIDLAVGSAPASTQVEVALLVLSSIAGVVSFGAPALLASAWIATRGAIPPRMRLLLAACGAVAGVLGVMASGFWWLGWFRS